MTEKEFLERFEFCFDTLFDGEEEFDAALRYACFGGGKRVRPLGVFLGASAVSEAFPLDEVLSLACAVELVHSYSLVHDDLPAMDDDDMRRGRPTVHKKFGEATAILVGDALNTRAAEVVTAGVLQFGRRYAAAASGLMRAAGDMVRGQVLDIAGMKTEHEFEKMYALKTGALIKASFVAGATVAGADEDTLDAVRGYAEALGLGFQIADDLLEKDEETSLVTLIGRERGEELLQKCTSEALRYASLTPSGDRLAEFATRMGARRR